MGRKGCVLFSKQETAGLPLVNRWGRQPVTAKTAEIWRPDNFPFSLGITAGLSSPVLQRRDNQRLLTCVTVAFCDNGVASVRCGTGSTVAIRLPVI